MRSGYKKLGDFIKPVKVKNKELKYSKLLGINIDKYFMPSVANVVGTNMARYKIICPGQFACNRMHVGRDYRIPIALSREEDPFIISPAYDVFKITKPDELDAEYLMMWFSRKEFDRNAWYYTDADVRGGLPWDAFCNLELPVPSIATQREVVAEYNSVVNRIKLNEQINQKLEETAQAIYRRWFVEFEFPISKEQAMEIGKPELEGKPYKSFGGKMVWNEELGKEMPEGWEVNKLTEKCSKIGSGATPRGGKESYKDEGISLIRSMNVYDYNFVAKELAFIDLEQATKLNNVEVLKNDILFNITGASVSRCTKVPENVLPARVNQHVAIIRTANVCYSNYLMSALCSEEFKRELIGISESGSTREAVTKDDLENIEMPFPDQKLCMAFDEIFNCISDYRGTFSSETHYLEGLGAILLSKMTKVETKKEREVV